MSDYSQSIVLIPTLNERENLKDLIPSIFGLMPEISVLVVDDNSSDGTRELVGFMKTGFKNLFLLERKNNFGYGRSSIDGFKWIFERPYDNVVTMDADFSHNFNEVPALLEKLKNSDVAMGSRYIRGGGVKNWSFFRRVLSRLANLYVKIILGLPAADATSGFNAYRVTSLKKINLDKIDSNGYAFLVELKYRLFRAGSKFIEHPILFSERREGQSKMSGKIIWESIKLPWKLKLFN
ncbi:MAG: hypothetical protein A3I26_00285 [Candidatus Yanofskybacteria bacterium RIFCSPLOWO2_02_FULL_43_10]|uniref:Glycosyltransferase 2-like domain-containing protein n=1 Tax=Candidatus Yanofskybacteria bacterium RIFCSPLOWO2_12_FULL_43_11b TaxID=1802710 RepID=A0A1F8H7F5_9BACT|nr:MAG: hypothetical protein A2742_00365 [Candidatus Yanofskybacteria bacterium RIFCSPHIGHO2_01_FULL_43_32]OGN11014.1 MAG: hypothetical protein A3C69_03505 [Candidatus Yanofskybacteria bacterium RIFCSPHIGHO2_02_FULL_43_12]OGN18165.1 MAG: hypothetical protein A3E34_02900 [Candidatus Yanofskybacteria bacterium RIFCSPHIGHO2_12_FULL_43_11]OGN24141.1 MAG: hypothetical protein A2923_02305 [Candidatus Yanofskybacteria bacterium RIFCSPLOWO2_01_FULL_43_46]OGN30542.1 MAG: hypothetical protein A3I26_00285